MFQYYPDKDLDFRSIKKQCIGARASVPPINGSNVAHYKYIFVGTRESWFICDV